MRQAAVIVAAAMMATAGSAVAETRAWSPERFDRVAVGGAYDVRIVTGDRLSVVAEGRPRDLARVRVRVVRGELRIDSEPGVRLLEMSKAVRLRVVAPRLKSVALGGSGSIALDRASGREFAGEVAGSGGLSIDAVDARAVSLSLKGSGKLAARGRCDSLAVAIAGSGDAKLRDLRCAAATVTVRGSGDVDAFARRVATVSTAGSGNVRIAGRPRCTISREGPGEVFCGA